MNFETIQSALNDYIVDAILLRKTPLAPDQSLELAGFDSMSYTRVFVFVEERFGVTIPDHEIDIEQIATLETMARFVHERVTQAGK